MQTQVPKKTGETKVQPNTLQATQKVALQPIPDLEENDLLQDRYANAFGDPLQRKTLDAIAPIQRKANNTGLPDNLKSGIENFSGYSMDDVKVHYNSDQPAQLNAHAYAQGTDIHIAPGQERHLPHEAWHVVQQKQGRVRPTMQLKGKVNVNDDVGLEREADVMGAKALQKKEVLQRSILVNPQKGIDTKLKNVGRKVVQRDIIVTNGLDGQREEKSYGPWGYQYSEKYGVNTFSRAKAAAKKLDGETFATREALFDRITELMEAGADRALQPLVNEVKRNLVAFELDYHFAEIDPLPKLELVRTYESNWDQKGGFSCEYKTGIIYNWVIHVHRGSKGGIKVAGVKTWAERKQKEASTKLFKHENLPELGIPEVSMEKKDEN